MEKKYTSVEEILADKDLTIIDTTKLDFKISGGFVLQQIDNYFICRFYQVIVLPKEFAIDVDPTHMWLHLVKLNANLGGKILATGFTAYFNRRVKINTYLKDPISGESRCY